MLDIIVDFEHKQKGTLMNDRHHLLECILWPNGDGTFRKIINTEKRLKELGIYDDYKLIIKLDRSTHQKMHRAFKKGTEYGREGNKNPMYGKGYLRAGDKNPMYGKGYLVAGDKSHNWKGDNASVRTLYKRANERFKAGEITEEEFQKYRDAWAKRTRDKKRMKNSSSSV